MRLIGDGKRLHCEDRQHAGHEIEDQPANQREQERDKQSAIQKDIRNFQKEQNSEKESREMAMTWLNILTIPLLLVAFGVALAVRRSSLRAAH